MIIFDLDGTLWETIDTTYEVANLVASKHSDMSPISRETVIRGMGLGKEENANNYMPYLEKEKAVEYLNEISKENFKLISLKGANIYDGVKEVIIELSNKYKLAVVTNNQDEYVETFFKVTTLEEYFIDYMGAGSYNISKGEAIKRVVLRNNENNNYYVGDIENDMIASEEAGVVFIHAKYGFGKDLTTKYYIDDIRDLPSLIKVIKE